MELSLKYFFATDPNTWKGHWLLAGVFFWLFYPVGYLGAVQDHVLAGIATGTTAVVAAFLYHEVTDAYAKISRTDFRTFVRLKLEDGLMDFFSPLTSLGTQIGVAYAGFLGGLPGLLFSIGFLTMVTKFHDAHS